MKKREINKKIKTIEDSYYKACDQINNKYFEKAKEALDDFRRKAVIEILSLKNNNLKVKDLRKQKEMLK